MAYLFDTDILIDYLRGYPHAVTLVEAHISEGYLSVMNVAELYQGVREGAERNRLAETVSAFTILPITTDIAVQGGLFLRDYRNSHGSGLADCLIAATVDTYGLVLSTLNDKHYPMIQAVEVPYKMG
jgi:predicted nucleic acid-binding protein